MSDYMKFLKSKELEQRRTPIPQIGEISEVLFPFQRECVKHLLAVGRGAAFLDTGLGKTIVQCEWARHIEGRVLFVAPLAVARQTVREAESMLGMHLAYCKDGKSNGKNIITNYERLSAFNASDFEAVVLDESSILKGFMSKTKLMLCEMFKDTKYKLACTATPAPNDYMELGNHSEFLGVMPSTEMLARWFINDPSQVGKYKLKGHAVKDFWQWVAGWASCATKPSDMGFPDDGYDLPLLTVKTHLVESPTVAAYEDGMLFEMSGSHSATEMHRDKRRTVVERVSLISKMVNASDSPWIIWCESNQESQMLSRAIPDAVEVKGSDSAELKEARLMAFTDGDARVIVSKPSICGFGMNWQHCQNIAFASISYSYEKFYQAVRRSWRFGQKMPVTVHVAISQSEIPIWRIIERKSTDHDEMKAHMKYATNGKVVHTKLPFIADNEVYLPEWLAAK